MSRKNIRYAREILVTQSNHWTLFPIAMLLSGVTERIVGSFDDPGLLLWLEVGLLPVLFFFFRLKIRSFWLLLICHGAAAALLCAILARETPYCWVYVSGAVCYLIYSVLHRLRREEPQDGRISMPPAVGMSAVSLFLQHHLGDTAQDIWYVLALITVFVMYYLSFYLDCYLNFLEVNESSACNIPEREIFASGSRMVVLYVLFAALVMFFTSGFAWLRSVLAAARNWIADILRVLLSGSQSGEETISPAAAAGHGGAMELPEAGEPFVLWEILERVTEVVFFCLCLYVAVRILLRLPAWIRERMERRGRVWLEPTEDHADVRERCELERPANVRGRRSPFAFMSTEERIRRLYKKRILSAGRAEAAKNLTDPAILTAREWGERLNRKELVEPYEKARYLGRCSAEDLRAMKSACR